MGNLHLGDTEIKLTEPLPKTSLQWAWRKKRIIEKINKKEQSEKEFMDAIDKVVKKGKSNKKL